MSSEIVIKILDNNNERSNRQMMSKWTNRVFRISFNCMVTNYLMTIYTLLVYKGSQNSISNKAIHCISIIAAWIPLLICILTGILYTYITFSRSAEKVKNRIYLLLLFQIFNSILIFLPEETAGKISRNMLTIILLLLFAVSVLMHRQIVQGLMEMDFSIEREWEIAGMVGDKVGKIPAYKWSSYLEKLSWLFVVPFVVSPTPPIFSVMTAIIAMLLLYVLLQYIKCYKSTTDEWECKINFAALIINFVVSVILGIFCYWKISWKLISFLVLYSAFITKGIEDRKYALLIRDKILSEKENSRSD